MEQSVRRDSPLTCSMTTLLLTGLVLMVQRYWPWSSHLMSRICRFHSLMNGRTMLKRKSSTTRRSSYVRGMDLMSSQATCDDIQHGGSQAYRRPVYRVQV